MICLKCNIDKSIEEFINGTGFVINKTGRTYLRRVCKKCDSEKHKRDYWANPDKYKERRRKSREINIDDMRKYHRHLVTKRKGINIETYDIMLKEQNGVCWICKETEPCGRYLAIDHDHNTGKVRGLLCTKCNTSLGKTNEAKLINMIKYLHKDALVYNQNLYEIRPCL